MRPLRLIVRFLAVAVLALVMLAKPSTAHPPVRSPDVAVPASVGLNLLLSKEPAVGTRTPAAEELTRYAFKGKKWRKHRQKRRIKRHPSV